jgi:hypothetical protein
MKPFATNFALNLGGLLEQKTLFLLKIHLQRTSFFCSGKRATSHVFFSQASLSPIVMHFRPLMDATTLLYVAGSELFATYSAQLKA